MKVLLIAALMAVTIDASAQDDDDYFVSTVNGQNPSDSVASYANLSAELRFLAENFRYLRPDQWPLGTRFMVVPGNENYFNVFFDRETDQEVSVASIRHTILEYRGHGLSSRGRTQLYFFCAKTGREYYHEVRNFTFEAFCNKSNTGVPALAYLDDVDKARELLVGKKMWTGTDEYSVDDPSSSVGSSTVYLKKNTPITIEKVGVGVREFPVKIVFADDKGNHYFQNVCMSRTNSGIRQEQLLTDRAKNAFENSFLFGSLTAVDEERRSAHSEVGSVLGDADKRDYGGNGSYSSGGSWYDIVGGIVSKGMTQDDVILGKGQPQRRSSYSRVNATWYYDDGTTVTFKNGQVVKVTHK